MRSVVYVLWFTHLISLVLPSVEGHQESPIEDQLSGDDPLMMMESKRGSSPSMEVLLRDNMPRFSRRTTDHMLRFTRGGAGGSLPDEDSHMLRFTRGGGGRSLPDEDSHMLRFTRGGGGRSLPDEDSHMLRFTRGGSRSLPDEDSHMLRFTRNSDDDYMLRFNRREDPNTRESPPLKENNNINYYINHHPEPPPLYLSGYSRPRRSQSSPSHQGLPLDLHMLRFSKKRNDDNHMPPYIRKEPNTPQQSFSRYTRKIIRPRLVRQDDHLLRFA